MNKFWVLFKANLVNSFKLNKVFRKHNKVSIIMSIVAVFGYLALCGLFFFYMLMFGEIFNEFGDSKLILITGISLSYLFIILITISTANNYLFRSRDFDLLMSLPVPTKTVVFSKIAYYLFLNYFSLFLIYFPTLMVYQIYNPTPLSFWLLAIPTFILIPLIPISITGIIAYLFGFIPLKQKYKTIITIIISFVFFFLIFWGQFQLSNESEASLTALGDLFAKINYPGQLAAQGMGGSILKYLFFVGLSLVPFVGFIYLVSLNYLKSNNRSNRSEINKKFVLKDSDNKSPIKALIIKEMRRYFSSAIYVINTIMSPLMSIVFLVLLIIYKDQIPLEIDTIGFNIIPVLFIGMFIFTLSLTSTTSSSISIEGKQFWILKTLPCKSSEIFIGKLFVNFLITVPFLLIEVIIVFLVFPIGIIDALFMFLIPFFVITYMSFIGLYVNLLLPRLDLDNDTKVVKQSLSTFITLLFGFIAAGILIVSAFLSSGIFLNDVAVYVLPSMVGLLFVMISFLLLKHHGTKLFERIQP